MSCKLSKLSCISDLSGVKRILFPNYNPESKYEDDSFDLWTESEWGDEDKKEGEEKEENWLNECLVALSSTSDVLVLALRQKAVFLTSKWFVGDDNDAKMKFLITYGDYLTHDDYITSLLCLPIASQKKTLSGGVDWTCIVVGFNSGYVRIYTEKAELLLSQLLHEEPVNKLKCQNCPPSKSSFLSDHQADELLIVYGSVVVSVDGFSLLQTLRACRSQLARVAAGKWEVIEAPPLTYKKWSFQENNKINDCDSIGVVTLNSFDYLSSQSLRSGFYASVRSSISVVNLYLTVGCNPYIGFYQATEEGSQLFLSDVAHAVANRLKSFFLNATAGSLLNWNQQPTKKQKIESPTTIPLKFGLFDRRRHGITINVSPNKMLAAVTDAFGRVIVFDIQKGMAIRMWKGYRDAQCGWIQVEDKVERDKYLHTPRKALFLVIYAPRRGILELWSSQQGPRVAAFNVGRCSKLLSPGHCMMGVNIAHVNAVKFQTHPCFLLSSLGSIYTISVPFHCALSDRNSKRARDIHLLKEFKTLLRSSKDKNKMIGDISKILLDIKSANIKQQAIDSLLRCNTITVDTVKLVIKQLTIYLLSQDLEQLDYESKLLLQTCCRIEGLIATYEAISLINENSPPENESNFLDIELISTKLNTSEAEIGRIMSLLALFQSVQSACQKKVRFLDNEERLLKIPFSNFVHTFIVSQSHLMKNENDEIVISELTVDLNPAASETELANTGEFLFSYFIRNEDSLSDFKEIIKSSRITTNAMITILIYYWLSSENINQWQEWVNFQQVLKHFCSVSDVQAMNSDSFPWDKVKVLLSQSTNNIAAYIGAVITRSVSIEVASSFNIVKQQMDRNETESSENSENVENKEEEKEGSDESDWEAISLDVEQWSLFVKQLEDVLILSILLKSKPAIKAPISNKRINISLSSLQSGGPGIMTDLVAAWCVDVKINPEILNTYTTESEDILSNISDQDMDKVQNISVIKGLLGQVRKRFPRSMDPDALLANCSWEYMVHWDKNHDMIYHLKSALQCLCLVMSAILRCGVAYMMWKTFVHKRFEGLVMLIEKVGKMPKDRLCRRDVEISDVYLENFVDFCTQLLEILLEANVISEVETIPMFPPEELWKGRDVHGPAPFVTLALQQPNPNYALIHHHYLLANFLLFIIAFQQKNVRPLSFYDSKGKSAFFKDLHRSINIPLKGLDTGIVDLRKQFLSSTVTAIVRNITQNDKYASIVSTASGETEASKWFNRLVDLCRGWDVDPDEIRSQYVYELYNHGHDTLAEEATTSVTEPVGLGLRLLALAGQRVRSGLSNAEDTAAKLAHLPPSLSSWLKTLDKPVTCSVPLSSTSVLLEKIINFLPESCSEQQMAILLLEAVNDLTAHGPN
ncbi:rab3 GTPase-activating protein non-catalytic subunit-like [Centruroides sculpturatus]|uniref:rab3 GTPase-activating protein non-catalytic subunit-like n=1 Tax=Centruroides sculpturatus TaxID=218467 RepID=UPI000C6E55C3|nr:rab3 GTPase-activating protein non-catalytic subunit-like [Centruroides sculpturatus]